MAQGQATDTTNITTLTNATKRHNSGYITRKQHNKTTTWKLLNDNVPAYRAIIVQDYLTKHSVSVLPHSPYSPNIAPCDFFFFKKLKMTLKGRRFSSSSEVIENATVELNKLRSIDFELAFQQLFSRWKKMKRLTTQTTIAKPQSVNPNKAVLFAFIQRCTIVALLALPFILNN
ncbi:hypothetical protein LAZ67_6001411 [Cordylochernes scorpioides]|uniref:Transposase n=1 Tax=Cordylochernes scorpioides TaxID=51811 RepID=A0ABY6KJ53_9ARAC|nr:hypothetical protein LAZ67_6001411 [Cordylochernes scorpioides]